MDCLSDEELHINFVEMKKQRNRGYPIKFGGKLHNRKNPTIKGDFRKLQFPDESFNLVVFDPPYLPSLTKKSFFHYTYGLLNPETWQSDFKTAIKEFYRVLKPLGILIVKWNNHDIPFKSFLSLALPWKPLFGQITSKGSAKTKSKTCWFCFMKIPKSKD